MQPSLFQETKCDKFSFEAGVKEMCLWLAGMDADTAMIHINNIREAIHQVCPMKAEPVDFVK